MFLKEGNIWKYHKIAAAISTVNMIMNDGILIYFDGLGAPKFGDKGDTNQRSRKVGGGLPSMFSKLPVKGVVQIRKKMPARSWKPSKSKLSI